MPRKDGPSVGPSGKVTGTKTAQRLLNPNREPPRRGWPLAASPERACQFCDVAAVHLSQSSAGAQAHSELRQSVEQKYEQYRTAIKNEHQIDRNFKDRIPEGVADGSPSRTT